MRVLPAITLLALSLFPQICLAQAPKDELRTWTSTSGSTIEARFSRMAGSLVVLIQEDGSMKRIRLGQLSSADQAWIRSHLQQKTASGARKPGGASDKRKLKWTDVSAKPDWCSSMTDAERNAVVDDDFKWRWAETPHFVIHYEKAIYALKVARMAEFFYDFIAEDLQGPKDHRPEKSHIYVFDSAKSWKLFLEKSGGIDWAAAYVRGDVMFLQRLSGSKASSNILAHEMTHLVLNRFFIHRPPHWLHEGLAEWYEGMGRALFKGTGYNEKRVFRTSVEKAYFPIDELLTAKTYPPTHLVHNFYNTSKYVVGFMRLEHDKETFLKYLFGVTLEGKHATESLPYAYGYKSLSEFTEAWGKFAGL